MNVLCIFRRAAPSKGHDKIAYSVSTDQESAFDAVSIDEDESSSRSKSSSLPEETDDCLSEYDLDDDILSQGSSASDSSSSTAISSTGTFPDQRAVVGVARRQRADTVRAVFHDPALWRVLDNFQVECCYGLQNQADIFPSMSMHRGDPWMFESDMTKDHVVVTVEVGVDLK